MLPARAQGPVLIKEVISREVGLFTGADPDLREIVSREVGLFVGADADGKEVVSREVSLVLSDAAAPPAIPAVNLTLSPRRDIVTLDWSGYDQWAVRDVAEYRIYYANLGFPSTDGMTPYRTVPGETFTTTFTGLPEFADFFFAVVPVDAAGHALAAVTPVSNYALTKEIISREVALFNGHEGAPQYRELVSREVSLLLSDTTTPPPVTGLTLTATPDGSTVTVSWDSYNQWAVRDVAEYRIYRSDTPFTTTAGMTPAAVVSGENFSRVFTGLTPWRDSFWAVAAADGQGHMNPLITYQGVYVISPQVISREVGLFNGHEPNPPVMREVVSREVSLVVASPAIPEPVTGVATGFDLTSATTQYAAIDVNWTSYNEAAQRDVKQYRIYVGTRFFDNVTGIPLFKTVADGTQRHVISGPEISAEQIYYVAVVAEDVNGNFNPAVYAESVKASVGELEDVSNVLAAPTPSTITYTWDLGGVGTNLQNFVKAFRVYLTHPDGRVEIHELDRNARSWTAVSLAFGGSYRARLTTVDMLDHESAGVTVVTGTPAVPPGSVEAGWNPGANAAVWGTMMQEGDWMIAMGDFTTLGGVARNRIARLDFDGKVDPAFHPNANNTVWNGMMQPDGKIVVCGAFTAMGGAGRDRIARLLPDGTPDTAFTAGANGVVRCMALQADGKIVLGGEFTQVNGVARNRLARLHADGSLDTRFDPNVNDAVRPIAIQPDGKILIGGNFTSVKGVARNRLARLLADGTPDPSFDPNADGQVNTLLVLPDGRILVGGAFTAVSGAPRGRLARLSPGGVLDPAFTSSCDGNVWGFARQTDGKTIVGGSFTTMNTVGRNRLARLLDDGTLDSVFDPNANFTVNGVMLQADGKIVVSGAASMTAVDGQPRDRLARLYNNPAPDSLRLVNIAQLDWSRGGASAEASETVFDVSTDGGDSWTALGAGSRAGGGWTLSGFEAPPAGLLRGRARAVGGLYNGMAGFVESRLAYNVMRSPGEWRTFYFNTPDNTGPAADHADPDGDGLQNLIERAFGQDPGDTASRAVPQWQWTAAYGTATFLAPAGISGVTYSAEWGETLAGNDWHAIPDTGSGQRHTFTFPLNDADRVFVRWRVSTP